MTIAAFFAVCSAFLYALATVITRIGLKHADTVTAVWISLLSCLISSLMLCDFHMGAFQVFSAGTFFFLLAGVIGPSVGRMFLFEGINRTGVSISTALFQTQPIYAVLAAIFIMGESLTLKSAAGLLMMTAGVSIASSKERGLAPREITFHKTDLCYPLIAGLCYGMAHILRKMGINHIPEPATGVVVQNIGALVFVVFLFLIKKTRWPCALPIKTWSNFIIAGILQMLAQWSLFLALKYGQVIIVVPLSNLTVVFVLILSAIFLKDLERVTIKIVIGALLIVMAAILLII